MVYYLYDTIIVLISSIENKEFFFLFFNDNIWLLDQIQLTGIKILRRVAWTYIWGVFYAEKSFAIFSVKDIAEKTILWMFLYSCTSFWVKILS